MRAAIVDYGTGNLASVLKGLRAAGLDAQIVRSTKDLAGAGAIVIPGVGHFSSTTALDGPWRDAIGDHAERGLPLLGICLGMQWLFEGSDEQPDVPGLAFFNGRVTRLPDIVKLPHVGWNTVVPQIASPLFTGLDLRECAYFTHSYAAPVTADTIATTEHGERFASIVQRGSVTGMQFHPEKSGHAGIALLRNWAAHAASIAPC